MQLGEFTLRQHQVDLFHKIGWAVKELRDAGRPIRVLVQLPCGGGKTLISSAIMAGAANKQKRSAFIVRGRLLVTNKSNTLTRCGLAHSILMDGEPYHQSQATVVSVDTYWSRSFEREIVPVLDPDVWTVDEAHLSQSDRWMHILKNGDVVIGFTATPAGKDGRGMGGFWEKLIIGQSYSQLLTDKLLVPCEIFGETMPDLSQLKMADGDWSEKKVGELMSSKELVGDVLRDWKRWGEDRPTLGFASSVKQSIGLAAEFNGAGIPTAHVDADTPPDEREGHFADLKAGRTKVIFNVGVLTTGVDFPYASCGILAFATGSVQKFMQVTGRLLRTYPGKADARIIDHGGNVHRHGWPTDDREWTLDTNVKIQDLDVKRREREQRQPLCCPKCGAQRMGGSKCTHCGFEHVKTGMKVRFRDGHIGPLKQKKVTKVQNDKQKGWLRILAVCAHRRLPCSAALAMFKREFGIWPGDAGIGPAIPREKSGLRVCEVFPGFVRRKTA